MVGNLEMVYFEQAGTVGMFIEQILSQKISILVIFWPPCTQSGSPQKHLLLCLLMIEKFQTKSKLPCFGQRRLTLREEGRSLGAQRELTGWWWKQSMCHQEFNFLSVSDLTSSWGLNQDNRTLRRQICKSEFELFIIRQLFFPVYELQNYHLCPLFLVLKQIRS